MAPISYVPLVEVRRGDTVESVHFGALAVVTATGRTPGSASRTLASVGDPGTVTFLRSAAKPAQVLPLLESGAVLRFGITDEEIAVMAGSHGGEPFHVEAVRSILGKIGLTEAALLCGAHPPYHRPSAEALRRDGEAPKAVHNNCSGKHAGMLALAVHLGAPVLTYLDPDHPVQTRIRALVERLAGLEAGGSLIGVDGCSAPSFAMPLDRLALLYARLVDPGTAAGENGPAARGVVSAMRRHPLMVAGTDRFCTALMQATGRNLIAKIGAEGLIGIGYEGDGEGVGIALKIADGDGQRARYSAALETLRQLGVLSAGEAEVLRARFVGDLVTHRGVVVGRILTTFELG